MNIALVHLSYEYRSLGVKLGRTGSRRVSSSNSKSLRSPNLIEWSDSLAGVDDGQGHGIGFDQYKAFPFA
jgi:hypothetical protein